MAAFRFAAALGVDVLELDLGMSRDGVLVVAHDPKVNPALCSGPESWQGRRLRDLSFAELRSLDCGALANPKFIEQRTVPGERLPRLEEVLALASQYPSLRFNIEVKTFADDRSLTASPQRFASALAQTLPNNLLPRVIVQSFDAEALRAVRRQLVRRVALSALVDEDGDVSAMLRDTGAGILSPHHELLHSREDIARYQHQGLRVIPWTVNEPQRMRQLIDWGVDGIISDRPDLLLKLRSQRGHTR